MSRRYYNSHTEWEKIVGYSRAIRIGNTIEVSGTTAIDEDGNVIGDGDAVEQTRYIFEKVQKALQELGADLHHIVRTRIYVTDIHLWEQVGRVHGELLAGVNPAATMVEVQGLIDPHILVEIEVTAVLDD